MCLLPLCSQSLGMHVHEHLLHNHTGDSNCSPFVLDLCWSWHPAPPPQVVRHWGAAWCDHTFTFKVWLVFCFQNCTRIFLLIQFFSLCFWALFDSLSSLLSLPFCPPLSTKWDQMCDLDYRPVPDFVHLVANSCLECLFWQVMRRWMAGPCCHLWPRGRTNILWHKAILIFLLKREWVSASSDVRNNLWNKSAGLKI